MFFKSGKKGFTFVEVLMSLGISVIIVVSVMAAAVFSLRFNTLERAKTLAQDVARNVMSQQVRTVKYETLEGMLTASGAVSLGASKSVTLFTFSNPSASKLTTSSLNDDLKKLNHAKCELNIRKLSDTQLDVKIRVLWDLKADGSIDDKLTRSLELSTVVSKGDFNLKRSAVLAVAINSTPRPSTCNPGCDIGKSCVNGTCVTNQPIQCDPACASGYTCDTGDGTCKPTQITCNILSPSCPTNSTCISGVCKPTCTQSTCPTGTTCDTNLGICTVNLNCSSSSPCASGMVCDNNKCIPSCTGTGATPCGAGLTCESSTGKCIAQAQVCSPACGNGYTCVGTVCTDNCELPTNRPKNCSCSTNSQCASGICRSSSNYKCGT